ncbi:hypothetical protein IP88_01750 [alpha proteobacterium AAP81b]|nr:hypothetical protein IP88_01750 [alpha proteobacterium AAP81b]
MEAAALLRLPLPMQAPMHLLFGLLTLGERHVNNFAIDAGVFYNCSYLAFQGGNFTGMHNILVTRDGPHVWYYNSNEDWPRWAVANDWRALTGQNGGTADYFFTGVCVTMRA